MYPIRALTKGIAVAFLVFFGSFLSLAQPFASVNIEGSRFEGVNSMRMQPMHGGNFAAFGTSRHLGVQFFDFLNGEKMRLKVIQNVNNTRIPVEGAGGFMFSDHAEFVLIGQLPNQMEEDKVLVLKADTSGKIMWAKTFIQQNVNQADKLFVCQNGDFLVCMKLDLRENSIGEDVFGSAIVRMDTSGNVKWYKNLDLRSEPESEIIHVEELVSGNLVIAQNYSNRLRLIKTTANGQLLSSFLSNNSLSPIALTFDLLNQRFFAACNPSFILGFDTAFTMQSHRSFQASLLRSFRTIKMLANGELVVGGDYGNKACLVKCDSQITPLSVLINENSGFATNVLQGFEETSGGLVSVCSPGFAITQHQADLTSSCFQNASLGVLNFSDLTLPAFTQYDTIGGSTSIANLASLSMDKILPLSPSSNCLAYDLSIQAATINNPNACRNVDFRWYIYNHGTEAINRFSIVYYLYGEAFDSTFNVTPIPSKTGRFVDFGSAYLDPGNTRLTYKVHSPNGQQDAFTVNDSLYADYQTVSDVAFGFNLADTICQGDAQEVLVAGPNGIYALFKNNILQEQSQSKFFVAQGAGSFYVRHTSAGGCFSFSDTVQVIELPKPPVPSITVDYDLAVLQSNALRPFWFFNSISQPGLVFVDSLVETIAYQGPGDYMVIDKSENGCSSEFLLSNIVVNMKLLESPVLWPFVSQNTLFNPAQTAVFCEIFAMDGKRLWFNTLEANESASLALSQGIYLLKTTKEGMLFNQKIWIAH